MAASPGASKGARTVEKPQTKGGTEGMITTSIGVQDLRKRIGEKAKADPLDPSVVIVPKYRRR